jgi:hypothetical protein
MRRRSFTPPLHRARHAAIAAAALLALAGCATPPGAGKRDADGSPVLERLTPAQWAEIGPQAPVRMSVATLVALSKEGAGPEAIIRRYYQTGSRLRLTGAQVADLRREGVDPRVLDYIASAEQDAARTDAITAQADQDARARLAFERTLYAGWWGGYSCWGCWGPGVFPYAGYGWGARGSGWFGGVGVGF